MEFYVVLSSIQEGVKGQFNCYLVHLGCGVHCRFRVQRDRQATGWSGLGLTTFVVYIFIYL
jgi:hypothetical protein